MCNLRHVALAILLFSADAAVAQAPAPVPTAYPTKPVRILVGFAPGGGIDIMARFYAKHFSESLGQTFVVDNRPGAGGNIATDQVAKAPPDGHTLIMVSMTHSINATLYAKLPYDAVKDFAAVSTVAITPNSISVHPSMPVKSARELIALAKARPGEISYASAGSGTLMHLAMELFRSMAGVKFLHVPYNGSGPSTIAVLGGQLPVLSTTLPIVLPHVRAGKLRMLGVTSAERTQLAPDFPTIAETTGLRGYEAVVWYGLLAPAGTPSVAVNKLNAEVARLLELRDVREKLLALGFDPYRHTPAAFTELIKSDIEKWGRIVRETGAKVD
jgi:tripartite-type tricarboxylate transporter receptor subunit TctC